MENSYCYDSNLIELSGIHNKKRYTLIRLAPAENGNLNKKVYSLRIYDPVTMSVTRIIIRSEP